MEFDGIGQILTGDNEFLRFSTIKGMNDRQTDTLLPHHSYHHHHCSNIMSHSHDEDDHGHHGDSHLHSPNPEIAPGESLYSNVDLDRVRCLNERVEGMAQSIIKPWDQRLDTTKVIGPPHIEPRKQF